MNRIVLRPRDFDWLTNDDDRLEAFKELLLPLVDVPQASLQLDIAPDVNAALLRLDGPPVDSRTLERLRKKFRTGVDSRLKNAPWSSFGSTTCERAPLANYPFTGKDVAVAVFDLYDVDDVSARFETRLERLVADDDAIRRVDSEELGDSHGSHVGSLLAGKSTSFASSSRIFSYRVGWAWNMVRAIHDALARDSVRVLCTAMTATDNPGNPRTDELDLLAEAIDMAKQREVVFVAAAGSPEMVPPATLPGAISVGAFRHGEIIPPCGESSPTLLGPWGPFDTAISGKTCFPGMSAAAPYLAGAIATWFEKNPKLTRARVLEVLKQTSRKLAGASDQCQGFGVFSPVDALAAV